MTVEEYNTLKKRFCESLSATGRKGVDAVVEGLERIGFFTAPASSKHHLAFEGGLLQHSLNVMEQALELREVQVKLNPDLEKLLPVDSVRLVGLLHDVCKSDLYKKVEKFRKDANNKWEKYTAYDCDHTNFPMGHGEKSVVLLMEMGLELARPEMIAIRWHMAGWDLSDSREANGNFSAACVKYPLLSLLIAADELATRITERGQ